MLYSTIFYVSNIFYQQKYAKYIRIEQTYNYICANVLMDCIIIKLYDSNANILFVIYKQTLHNREMK